MCNNSQKTESNQTSSYTGGPWKLWKDCYPTESEEEKEHHKNIVVMPEPADYDGTGHKYASLGGGNVEANARLVAAAPELLEALQKILEYGGGEMVENNLYEGDVCILCQGPVRYRGLSQYVDHEDDCPVFDARKAITKAIIGEEKDDA